MALATSFDITFGCRHAGTIDLSALPADRRGGRLAYLQDKGLCDDCFTATREKRRELERTRWLTARRRDEAAEAAQWAQQYGFVTLTGTPKQVAYAERVRFELMRELYGWAVEDGAAVDAYQHVEQAARGIDDARWWLDQKTVVGESADLLELLEAAAASRAGQLCENSA